MAFYFTKKHLRRIRKEPIILGRLMGFKKLKPVHNKMIINAWTNKEHNGLQCHRGGYKSTAVSIVGAAWYKLFNPDDRIAIVRKTATMAENTLRAIKTGIKVAAVTALFAYAHKQQPKMLIDKVNSVTFSFNRKASIEGCFDAWSVHTIATGTHYDKILCDDITTKDDRYSTAEREKTIQSLMEIISNIIDPGKVVIVVGTPWHKADIWAYLEKAEIQTDKYMPKDVGVLSEQELQDKLKTTTKSLWMANYFLEHVSDEDLLFQDPMFGKWDTPAGPVYCHIDAKYKGEDTGAMTIAYRRADGYIHIRGWSFEEHAKKKIQFFKTSCRKRKVKKVYCENNNDQMEYLAEKLRERDGIVRGLNVETYHESTNKHQKIVSYISEFWEQLIFDDETDEVYLDQVLNYMEGEEPDDAPDSLASMLRACFFSSNSSRDADALSDL